MDQGKYLSVAARIPAATLKTFTEDLLDRLPPVRVIENRTGLVMLPYTDTREGTAFHLGEALVAEARIVMEEAEGYGACLGRDLEQALAVAILDAAMQAGQQQKAIEAFLSEHARLQAEEDEALLRQVAATRVEMETF